MEVCGQLHVPAALLQGKSTCYPLDRRLGGPQRRSRGGGEEKNSQPLPGLEPPIMKPVVQLETEVLGETPVNCHSAHQETTWRLTVGTTARLVTVRHDARNHKAVMECVSCAISLCFV
jgi:hypothetical protein